MSVGQVTSEGDLLEEFGEAEHAVGRLARPPLHQQRQV